MSKLPYKHEFEQQVGTPFTVKRGSGEPFPMELNQLVTLISTDTQECFSLRFIAPPQTEAAQDVYQLSHPSLGEMSLLLVPVGRRDDEIIFEAVFNNFVA